jgi:hypothetical protein
VAADGSLSLASVIWAAVLSGFAASALTAWAGYLVARKQIRATLVSTNRMRWIYAVRNTVSELASIDSWAGAPGAQRRRELFLSAKLWLLLNPDEEPSQVLLDKLASFKTQLSQWSPGTETPDFAEVKAAAQIVLKAEWVRVKKGK